MCHTRLSGGGEKEAGKIKGTQDAGLGKAIVLYVTYCTKDHEMEASSVALPLPTPVRDSLSVGSNPQPVVMSTTSGSSSWRSARLHPYGLEFPSPRLSRAV